MVLQVHHKNFALDVMKKMQFLMKMMTLISGNKVMAALILYGPN
jgi:hypothetical protein